MSLCFDFPESFIKLELCRDIKVKIKLYKYKFALNRSRAVFIAFNQGAFHDARDVPTTP